MDKSGLIRFKNCWKRVYPYAVVLNMKVTGLSEAEAEERLTHCGGELKTAIVAALRSVSPEAARRLLADADGHLRRAIEPNEGLTPTHATRDTHPRD